VLRYAAAGVLDEDQPRVVVGFDPQVDGAAARRVADGVDDEVPHRAGHLGGGDRGGHGSGALTFELDPVAHRTTLGGAELALTTREFDLLHWFLAHPGQAQDRERLMRQVWGWEFGDLSTVTVHVRRLREKVETEPSRPTRLVTVFGVGYRWDPAS
jgi:hypothetical protein